MISIGGDRKMNRLVEEIVAAIAATGAKARVSVWTRSRVEASLDQRFGRAGPGPLWERLEGESSVRDPDGWRRAGELVGSEPCLLFLPGADEAVFEFDRGSDLTVVLGECSGFEFGVTDTSQTFVVLFNHHDFLITAGLGGHVRP